MSDDESGLIQQRVEAAEMKLAYFASRIAVLDEIVQEFVRERNAACKHKYEGGFSVVAHKRVINGIDVNVPNVDFGATVYVQTNRYWEVEVCTLCGAWKVSLPKAVELA